MRQSKNQKLNMRLGQAIFQVRGACANLRVLLHREPYLAVVSDDIDLLQKRIENNIRLYYEAAKKIAAERREKEEKRNHR